MIEVVEVGTVDQVVAEAVPGWIASVTGIKAGRARTLPCPQFAWDPARKQYGAIAILRDLAARTPPRSRVVGLTECDLFVPVLSFVFGQAQLNGRLALVSLARLRQEFYGLPPHQPTLLRRALTETVHELGHTFGLVHCAHPLCAMSLSIDVRQVDRKQDLCATCKVLLAEGVAVKTKKESK